MKRFPVKLFLLVAVYQRYLCMQPKTAGMKGKFVILFFCGLMAAGTTHAQDSLPPAAMDTSISDYDFLINELDMLLDSLMTPHSFFMINMSAGSSYLSYETKSG